jgi:hypothetical protein
MHGGVVFDWPFSENLNEPVENAFEVLHAFAEHCVASLPFAYKLLDFYQGVIDLSRIYFLFLL